MKLPRCVVPVAAAIVAAVQLSSPVEAHASGSTAICGSESDPGARYVASAASSQEQQNHRLRVIDSNDRPIPYSVVDVGKQTGLMTDTLGHLSLPRETAGAVRFRVRRVGFAPFDGEASPDANGEYVVVLGPLIRKLDTIRTVASSSTPLSRTGYYDRLDRSRKGAFRGEFITPEELEMRGGGSLSQIFYGRQLVSVVRSNPLRLGGRGGCIMQTLLDGKLILEPNIEDIVSTGMIMAIEIYASTANAPAELIPVTFRGSCGLIAIWTGSRAP